MAEQNKLSNENMQDLKTQLEKIDKAELIRITEGSTGLSKVKAIEIAKLLNTSYLGDKGQYHASIRAALGKDGLEILKPRINKRPTTAATPTDEYKTKYEDLLASISHAGEDVWDKVKAAALAIQKEKIQKRIDEEALKSLENILPESTKPNHD